MPKSPSPYLGDPPPDWTGEEPCQRMPELFHPEPGEDERKIATAKWICSLCPRQIECYDWAMGDPTLWGIHAGTTRKERTRLRRLAG